MSINTFDNSRVAGGTLNPGAQKPANVPSEESSAISRDDVRDGVSGSPMPRRENPPARGIRSAAALTGDRVCNPAGEDLGTIEELMVDIPRGRIAYAVLSFGGFLGLGDKLFALPWSALRFDDERQEFIVDIDRKKLENAPGFDKDHWPDMADPAFAARIHGHYGKELYWEYEPSTTRTAGGRQ